MSSMEKEATYRKCIELPYQKYDDLASIYPEESWEASCYQVKLILRTLNHVLTGILKKKEKKSSQCAWVV
jgi:hypothetical protein